jgi:hypothetical protein
MDEATQRMIRDFVERLTGPLHFRLVMQPAMALFLGIRDGRKDARESKPAYFWEIFTQSSGRADLLKNGFKSIMKLFIMAITLDAIYQLLVVHRFYPGEALLVALSLAFVPYLFIRGPANRFARWWASHRPSPHTH